MHRAPGAETVFPVLQVSDMVSFFLHVGFDFFNGAAWMICHGPGKDSAQFGLA